LAQWNSIITGVAAAAKS